MESLGAAGWAILAVSAIAGLAITGFMLAVYAAHCFLTIVIDSGCGIDEIRMPDESFTDWSLKPVYLVWLFVGSGTLLGVLLLPFLFRDVTTYAVALAVALFVLYPITLLSSLTGKSWVALLHWPFLRRLVRWPMSYVLMLVLAAPLVLAGAGVLLLTLSQSLWWVFLAAPVLPLALLWYARLLGRYAWLVTHTPLKKKRRPKPAAAAVSGVRVQDPWAPTDDQAAAAEGPPRGPGEPEGASETGIKVMTGEPPAPLMPDEADESEDEWTPVKKPYGVMDEAQSKKSYQERKVDPLGDEPGYEVNAAPLAAPFSLTSYYDKYWKDDEKRRARTDPPPPPRPTFALAFGSGLFLFPFYGATFKPWFGLGFLAFFALFCGRVLVIAAGVLAR